MAVGTEDREVAHARVERAGDVARARVGREQAVGMKEAHDGVQPA